VAKSGEKTVKEYLENRGLKAVKVPEGDIKTVDFKVYYQNRLVCYLEEKTIELTPLAWKDVDPFYNAIAKHIYEAVKQFKSVNPARTVPNVLSLTNMDPAKNVNDLFTTLTGHVITPRGKMRRIPNMKRLEDDLSLIDLYLWFDQDQLTGHIYDQETPNIEDSLIEMLGLEQNL